MLFGHRTLFLQSPRKRFLLIVLTIGINKTFPDNLDPTTVIGNIVPVTPHLENIKEKVPCEVDIAGGFGNKLPIITEIPDLSRKVSLLTLILQGFSGQEPIMPQNG